MTFSIFLNGGNDPLALKMTLRQDVISFDAHKQWFDDILFDEKVVMLIGVCNEERIGVCRFSISDDWDYADVSININPVYRGKGLGHNFLGQPSLFTHKLTRRNCLLE